MREIKSQETNKYIDEIEPIAILEIPKINLKGGSGKGVDDDVIKYAVGHFKDTVMPGERETVHLQDIETMILENFFLN